jgi:hypothetical protein
MRTGLFLIADRTKLVCGTRVGYLLGQASGLPLGPGACTTWPCMVASREPRGPGELEDYQKPVDVSTFRQDDSAESDQTVCTHLRTGLKVRACAPLGCAWWLLGNLVVLPSLEIIRNL